MNDMSPSPAAACFEDQALLFVSGGLPAPQRRTFELLLQCDAAVRDYAASLAEAAASLSAETPTPVPVGLKDRVMALADNVPQEIDESLVMSNAEGRVQWVSPCFSEMCGYPLEELEGRRLGPILQGEKTDRQTAARLRRAVSQAKPCREVILNYRKNGTPYWAEVELIPVADDAGRTARFIALEKERKDLPLP